MKKIIAMALALMLMLVMVGCGQTQETTVPKSQAPNLFIYDYEGNQVTLKQFAGKPVVLNFWASWCEPCMAEMSGFQEQYEAYGDQVQFIMVNMTDGTQETPETAMAFINQEGYTFPVYFDSSSLASLIYGIQSIPATFFIDADGYLVANANGAISKDALEQGIQMILP